MLNKLTPVAALVGCGGEDVPSCQVAVTHYYDSGCSLIDLQSGRTFTINEVIQSCKDARASAPPQCIDELDNLQSCFGGVPAGASNAQCQACSDEQDAILTCQ